MRAFPDPALPVSPSVDRPTSVGCEEGRGIARLFFSSKAEGI